MNLEVDQRAREDLDLFLLALISQGINTPYRMQSQAGISQGASLKSLQRLQSRNLVSSKEGPRKRQQFSLTRTGRNRLMQKHTPGTLQRQAAGDFESILRTALLMAFVYEDARTASLVLKKAAIERRGRSDDVPGNRLGVPDLVAQYTRIRETRTAAIGSIEAEIFENLAAYLKLRSKWKE